MRDKQGQRDRIDSLLKEPSLGTRDLERIKKTEGERMIGFWDKENGKPVEVDCIEEFGLEQRKKMLLSLLFGLLFFGLPVATLLYFSWGG